MCVHSYSPENNDVSRTSQGVLSDSKMLSVSISTQTDEMQGRGNTIRLKTIATQTSSSSQSASQSTPLLSSLICSQRAEESQSSHQETSTSPTPEDCLLATDGTGDWAGVDGVNRRSVTWDSCAPPSEAQQRSVDDDILQDVFR